MLSQLGKDLYKAQYRIFDHRVFVNGEIETFLRNFETERNDLEVESLFKLTETVGAIKYQLSSQCLSIGAQNLKALSNELQRTLLKTESLLQNLPKEHSSAKALFKERHAQRLGQREQFEKQLSFNYQRVDNSFTNKEEEIAELYSDLQFKINISKEHL